MLTIPYVEGDCVVPYKGHDEHRPGAIVTDESITAYFGQDNVLTNYHEEPIGTYRIKSSWHPKGRYSPQTMYQAEANVDGRYYNGRSAGLGMRYDGKRIRLNHRVDPFGRDCKGNISGYRVVSGRGDSYRVHAIFVGSKSLKGSLAIARKLAYAKLADLERGGIVHLNEGVNTNGTASPTYRDGTASEAVAVAK